MLKKALGLVLTAVMLLGVFGLTACNNDSLDAYKAEGKAAIEAYAQERKDNYCDSNWMVVRGIVEEGNQAIDEAVSKAGVDTAVTTAKTVIDAIEEESMGKFYSLQEAYDEGLLTVEDLRSIAHYQSAGKDEPNFVPTPMSPEVLSSETIEAIKKTYLVALCLSTHQDGTLMFPNATIDDVNFLGYFGTYGNTVAIKISDELSGYAAVVLELVVAGVTFTYTGVPVAIWKSI